MLQPGEQRGRRQDLDPGGRQFDGQRQAVEPAADARHRLGVLDRQGEVGPRRPRPLDEEADGARLPHPFRAGSTRVGRECKGRDRVLPLAGEP